jgi:hypothetical protein
MVIAMDQDHARGIAKVLKERSGVQATIATSDDPLASRKIADFTDSSDPWIVAVRMVSEGVDIPRLKVGVYATNTVTDLFFRQAVGRLVRATGGSKQQRAYMFIPDDARLRTFAFGIAEQRRHSLRKPERDDDDLFDDPSEERAAPELDQLSLFSAISAVPLDENGNPLDGAPLEEPDGESAEDEEGIPGLVGEETAEDPTPAPFSLAAQDFEDPVPTPFPSPDIAASPRTRKRKLREQNSAIVRALVHKTGLGHAQVNAELNQRIGLKRVTEATVAQLDKRLDAAKKWLERA